MGQKILDKLVRPACTSMWRHVQVCARCMRSRKGEERWPRPQPQLGSVMPKGPSTHVSFVGREFPVFSQNRSDQNSLPLEIPERSYASICKVSMAAGVPAVYVEPCPPLWNADLTLCILASLRFCSLVFLCLCTCDFHHHKQL